MAKAAAGTVQVESFRGRLRLRFRIASKQYCLSLGLPDTLECRAVAEITARQIWLDILSNNFDPTLEKYKRTRSSQPQRTITQLFDDFISHRERFLDERSTNKYRTLCNHLVKLKLDGVPADELTEETVQQILVYFNRTLCPRNAKDMLILLRAVLHRSGIENSYLQEAIRTFKTPPKQPAKPFSQDEVKRILEAFSCLFPHYYNYVLFRFSTGMRTAEVNGLQWQHVADDCSQIWVGSSLRRRVRKSTKTNKARIVPCNQTVQTLLLEIKSGLFSVAPTALVFTTPRGHAIHDNAFASQYWQPALLSAGVEYRKPYLTRHTFISHLLQAGMKPLEVSAVTGHDTQIMYQHYAGLVSRPVIPDIFPVHTSGTGSTMPPISNYFPLGKESY